MVRYARDSARSLTWVRIAFAASLCLNGLLVALTLSPVREPSGPLVSAGRPGESVSNPAADAPGELAEVLDWRSRRAVEAQQPRTPPWALLQGDSLPDYVANLRHAGFPEPMVQVILFAELDRQFAARGVPDSDEGTNYWRTGPQRDAMRLQQRLASESLEAERRAAIRELLGVEWHEVWGGWKEESVLAWLAGPNVPPEQVARLNGLWARIEDQARQLKSSEGLVTRNSEARRRQAYDNVMKELEQALGSEAFEELQVRAMAMNVTDVWGADRLFGVEMTGQEFREFLRIRKEIEPPLLDLFDVNAPPPGEAATQAVEDQLRTLLGEERFQGYQRAKDPQFRWIRGAFPREPMELTWAVYDVYAGLKTATGAVRDQIALSDTDRQAALRQLGSGAEETLKQVMGPDKYAEYTKGGSDIFKWVTELTR